MIAATNRPLGALRRDGRFREDFFYRLCSDVIEVPTLRQRVAESPAELELLVRLLVSRIAGSEDPSRVLEALPRDLPRGYPWPGNVRELEQAVRRILLTGRYAAAVAETAWGRLLGDPSRAVRRATVDAMVDAGRPALRPLLERALGDSDAWTRWKALRGLVELGIEPSRAVVAPLAEDPDFRVRLESTRALRAGGG